MVAVAADELETLRDESVCPVPEPRQGWRETFDHETLTHHLRRHGKHFMPRVTAERLKALRAELQTCRVREPGDARIAAFLEVLLDKEDQRYDYVSYLALPLLELPARIDASDVGAAVAACRRRVSLLIADLTVFERSVEAGENHSMPKQRPDDNLRRRRLKGAAKVLSTFVPIAEGGEAVRGGYGARAEDMARRVLATANADEARRLCISMQPVYVSHDEYLFLRVLQSFETVFHYAHQIVGLSIDHALKADGGEASLLRSVSDLVEDALRLFAILDTMQAESFQTFRAFTEGASAIQSRSYKRFEAACQSPNKERFGSPAYGMIPAVREEVLGMRLGGTPTLYDAWRTLNGVFPARAEALGVVMARLDGVMRKWKYKHYGMALKMLGEATGTGYTEGTPYLKSVKDLPMFRGVKQ